MPQKKKQQEEFPDPFANQQVPPREEFADPFKEEEFPDPFGRQTTEQVVERGIKEGIKRAAEIPLVAQTISTIAPVLDFVSRPGMASARFADALADESKGVLDAVSEAWDEFVGTQASGRRKKISFSDVIKRRIPEFAINKPEATILLGLVGDVALDPTSYLGVGTLKSGITVGGKVLSKSATEALEQGLKVASKRVFLGKNGTLELVEALPKATSKAEIAENRLLRRVKGLAQKPNATIKDEAVYFTKQISAINKKADIETELKQAGYFDAVRAKGDEIEKFFNDLTGINNSVDPSFRTDVVDTLARSETITDLQRVAKDRLPDELFIDEVRDRYNSRIQYLANLNPKLSEQFFQKQGVYIKAGLPFGKQKDLIRLVGLERISNKVKAISTYMESVPVLNIIPKGIDLLGSTFNRNYGLPEEYIKFRDELENELGYLSDEMIRNTRKMFKDFSKEEREKIGEAMHWIDDETRKLEEIRSKSSDPDFQNLTDGEAAQITQQGMDLFKLDDKSKSIVGQMQQSYKEAGLLEMRAGLLKNNLLNYSPRGYEVISGADEMSLITRGKYGQYGIPQPFLASSHSRKYATKAEAEEAGLSPELDAALLYAHRILSSKRALSIQQFKDSVTELFGSYNPKGKTAHTGILPTAFTDLSSIPPKVIDDMKMIGEAVYPSGTNSNIRKWIRGFDKLQSWVFKRPATTFRPSFAPKQLISNTFQAAMISGLKAFKAFDPRVAADASILMMRGGKPLEKLPSFLTNFISKHFTGNNGLDGILASRTILSKHFGEEALNDFASQYSRRTALGQEFTGTELIQLARENGIIRGFDATGEAFSTKLQNEILKETQSYKNVAGTLGKYWNHAAMVEDYSRMMLFINGISLGYTPKDAAKVVNKALFDYSRGLSDIEKTVFRRIIPFYTFQRFAIPFVLKQTFTNPSQLATLEKLMRTTEKLLITGEELNEGEVNVFNEKGNNFLLTQPRLLTGFDNSGKATLNVLNNITPYDVLNMQVYDKEGNVDYGRTSEKVFLASLTPFLKVPLEWVFDRDFFTGKTIEQASKFGNLEGSIGKILPDFAKELMGWETATNKITGKTSTYISPYMSYYLMQFFPPLRDFVKSQEDLVDEGYVMGPLYSAMNLIYEISTPIKSQQVDLKEMNIRSLTQKDKDISDIKADLIRAKIEGRDSKFEEELQQLKRYVKVLAENSKARAGFNIRGEGIRTQTVNSNIPAEVPEQPTPVQEFK